MAVHPPPEPALAGQVARLFFDRQMTKVEIAAHLGISRFRVARLLDRALADGLVRIEYRDLPREDRALATALEERHGLDLCAVAEVGDGEPLGPVARLAGSVIDGLIDEREIIGIAWGSTLAAVVAEIPGRRAPDIEVVQLAGGSSRLGRARDAGHLARALADRLGGTDHPLHAPAFVRSRALRRGLADDPEVAATLARFDELTMAIVGIGAIPVGRDGATSSLLGSGALDDAAVARMVERGAVGDLVVHPFDAAGRFIDPDLAARSVAIGIDALRRVPRVVAVAVGTGKAAAIRGALATGIIRVLITDRRTAAATLEGG